MTHVPFVILCLVAPPSSAGTPQPEPGPPDQDADAAAYQGSDGTYRKYDFEGDTVDGESLSPDGRILFQPAPAERTSLIRIRGQFNPELLRMSRDM